MQYPYDPYQIGALVFFCAIVACCYGLQVPVIQDKGKQTALVVIYTVLVFIGFFLNFLTSWLDPSDPGLDGAGNGDFYCSLCEASVGRSSKHCKACDRCVEGFDHHCKWLNNCIGKRNYKPFVVLVSGTLSACIVQFAWLLWLIVRSFEDEEVLRPSLQESYGGDVNYIGWQVFLFIYLVLLLAAIIMVGELFSFHVVLISKGLTTYEYILSQREKQAFEDGKSGMAESMDTAKGVFKCLCCCKQNRVQDESQAAPRARPKVGLNPCAALTATKPEHLSFASGIGKHAGKEDASPHAIAKAADEAFGRKDSHSTGSPAHHFTVSNGFTNGTNPLSVGGSPVSEHRLPSRAPSPLDASSIHQPPNFSALRALPPQSLQQGTRMHALHGPGYGHSYGQGVGQGQRGVQSHSPLGGYGQGMGQGQPQGSLQRYQQKWDVGGVQSLSPLGAGVGADPVSVQRQQQQQRQQQATQLTQQQAAQAEQQLQLLEQTRQQQLRQQQHTHVHVPPSPSYPHPAFTPDMHEHESLQPSLADDLHAGSLTPHPQQHALPTSLTHSSHPTATPPPRSRVAPLPPIHTPASTNTQSSFATSPTQPPTSTHELRDSASIRGSDPRFNPDPWAQQGQCQGPDVCVDQGRHPSGGGPGPHSYSSAQPSAWSRLYPSYDPELAQNSPGVS